jgi:N6-adenosine-specific RNA methylase IME4
MHATAAIRIDPEFKALIRPLKPEESERLEADLKVNGCLDPLKVWAGHDILIDGHNRYEFCRKHSIPFEVKEMEFKSRRDVKIWVIYNQFARRNLAPFERVELALVLESLFKEMAKENQRLSPGRGKKGCQNSDNLKVDTKKEIAKAAQVSHDTVAKAKVIKEKAPEPVKAQLRNGETTINKVYSEITKKETKQAVVEKINAEPPPVPEGPFRVIAIDPPWSYENRADDATHRAANPYPSMSLDAIKALPVSSIAHEDCILWLWTTNAHMRVAFEVLDAWGFTYKTILTWVKDRMGTGDWLRGRTEHCLMAVRGKPTVTLGNQTTVIEGPLREHSRKPESFYLLVESLCPGSKVELFARQPREGWAQHGGEIGKFQSR